MANKSIIDAFERLWSHITTALNDKANISDLENINYNISALQSQLLSDSLILQDAITGNKYKIQIQNGQLVSFPYEEEPSSQE